jgi:drug/metabolite transporter (DMT)-like permease
MIWALLLGYAMFGEIPTAMIVLGSAIIAGAGLFVIWREHQLALAHKTAAEVSPAVTAALPSSAQRAG